MRSMKKSKKRSWDSRKKALVEKEKERIKADLMYEINTFRRRIQLQIDSLVIVANQIIAARRD